MQIGDKKTERMTMGDCHPVTKTGTVVYIHPARLFYILEFDVGDHKVRESYYFPARLGEHDRK